MLFEVLTPLVRCQRTNIPVDRDTFTSVAGMWMYVDSNGFLKNFQTGTPQPICRLVFDNVTLSKYESNETAGDHVSVLEPFEVRVLTDNFVGVLFEGDHLVVSVESGEEGKLRVLDNTMTPGTYSVVADVEEVLSTTAIIIRTLVQGAGISGGVAPVPVFPGNGAINVPIDVVLEWA